MIDTQSVDDTALYEIENQRMNCPKDVRLFQADRSQIVNVKKPAVIDLIRRDAPIASTCKLDFPTIAPAGRTIRFSRDGR